METFLDLLSHTIDLEVVNGCLLLLTTVLFSYVVLLIIIRMAPSDLLVQQNSVTKMSCALVALVVLGYFYMESSQYSDGVLFIVYEFLFVLSCLLAKRSYDQFVRGPGYIPTNLQGKTILVTGANTGIGFETARQLALMNAHVILACRSQARAESAMTKIKSEMSSAQLTFIPLDLGSLKSVREFGRKFQDLDVPLDVLINNAGLNTTFRSETADGFEKTFGVNHLGPFLLTNLLLPSLKKSPGARIVNLGSCAARWPTFLDLDNIVHLPKFDQWVAYSQSKLCNVLFTLELSKRLAKDKIMVNCVHPGLVKSDIIRDFPAWVRFAYQLLMPICDFFQQSAAQGAFTSIFAAISPAMGNVSGKFLVSSSIQPVTATMSSNEDALKLWDLSCKLTGV